MDSKQYQQIVDQLEFLSKSCLSNSLLLCKSNSNRSQKLSVSPEKEGEELSQLKFVKQKSANEYTKRKHRRDKERPMNKIHLFDIQEDFIDKSHPLLVISQQEQQVSEFISKIENREMQGNFNKHFHQLIQQSKQKRDDSYLTIQGIRHIYRKKSIK